METLASPEDRTLLRVLAHTPELLSDCGRVRLIPYDSEHHSELARLLEDPRIWEQGFAPGRAEAPSTPEEMEHFLTQRANVPMLFTVLVDGEIAGTTGIVKTYSRKKVLLGRTFFGAQFWGLGLNSVTKQLMLTWLFSNGVSAVECEVGLSNLRSLRSLSRIGFVEVGTRRRNTPGGRAPWRTLVLMKITRVSWNAAQLELIETL